MEDKIKKRVVSNQFVDKLRMELIVDEEEYQRLRAALLDLSAQWKTTSTINKELMQEIYVLPSIIKNMAPEILGRTFDVEEKATEIDALIMDCLAS